ncbi:MAG TPA: galactokinase, partial [Micromonosporaceae bacterium]
WAAYVAGVVWALVDAGHDVPPADIAVESDILSGAGLSSSAALECAVLSALCDLGDLDVPWTERPALARRAENAYVGVPCGIMDQTAAMLSRAGHALFLDCRNFAIEHVPFDLRAAGLELLVVDSHARHRHVENEYTDRQRACQDAARLLGVPALRDVEDLDAALSTLTDPVLRRRVRHVVTENARVLAAVADLRDGRLRDIGPLLTDSHASMRDDYEITVPEVDLVVEVALANGGYGARMTGGGFGGCVLALVDAGTSDDVAAAVCDAFAGRGYAAPSSFVAYPSGGASRVA